jgi:ribosomal-protein-alanine N-acetyltransferase
MLTPPAPLRLRPMMLGDIAAVMAVDRASFPTPAKEQLFINELTDNVLAHYHVLSVVESGDRERIAGFSGYWLIADEIHISTIAVAPEVRGRRWGELLLLNLLLDALGLNPILVTLEVRRSNLAAQRLYAKYRFDVVGERRRYYHDTGEDAILMTVLLAEQPDYADWLDDRAQHLLAALAGAE